MPNKKAFGHRAAYALVLCIIVGVATASRVNAAGQPDDGVAQGTTPDVGGGKDHKVSGNVKHGTIHVEPGRTKILHPGDVSHIAVGDGEVMEAQPLKKAGDVVVIGEHEGETDLRVWVDDRVAAYYKVYVSAADADVEPGQLRRILGDADNLRISKVNGSLNIVGRANSKVQYGRVQALTSRFEGVYSYVEEPNVQADKETVFIKARFLEVSNNAVKDLGVDWSDNIQGPTFASANDFETNNQFRPEFQDINDSGSFPLDIGTGNNYFGIGVKLTSTINFMVQNGYARQIAEPTLSARSGESAKFNSGGKIPIPFETGQGGQQTQFENYGIKLKVKPEVAEDGKTIRSSVNVEVSDIDKSLRVKGIPGITERTAETVMTAPSGRSLVIAGLVDRDDSKTVNKVPILGDIPVLGELFKSRKFRNDDTQLVIVMTPYVGGTESRVNKALMNRQSQLNQKGEDLMQFHLVD